MRQIIYILLLAPTIILSQKNDKKVSSTMFSVDYAYQFPEFDLKDRFGYFSHKSGAFFFFLSRTLGASLRLFLVAKVLDLLFFSSFNIPFFVTSLFTIFFIWVYTHKGGIKTIIWTDTLQTTFMLLTVVICIYVIFGIKINVKN